ncbi:MAG: 4Fe-4S dicluster domain-containing protein [Anaerolineae bacterium]|nr:4Fe-4S dicluster domain-containing protein [Anaerolineae bacterium]
MAHGTIWIDVERCKGCELCIAACPHGLVHLDPTQLNAKGYHPAQLNDPIGRCTGCALCAVVCPDVAIRVYREPRGKRAVDRALAVQQPVEVVAV